MADLGKQQVAEFLASVAEATPAPGGGSSAATAAGLAAALVEMSAGLASLDAAAERAAGLRGRALELAEEELYAYAPVLAATTSEERSAALAAASESPAQVAELAAQVAKLGIEVAEAASPAVSGDALTGVILAEAAAAAAARLVAINTRGEGPVHERAQAAARSAAAARAAG